MLATILFYSFLGSVASLVGGVLLATRKKRFTHVQSLLLVSFAAGVLLATAVFDLLPEAFEVWGEREKAAQSGTVAGDKEDGHTLWFWVMGGIIFLFSLEKSFLWYHHHHEEEHENRCPVPVMMTVGDTIHNFVDGVVIGGAFLVNPSAGIVTALAVAAHEIPHEIADFGVLLSKEWSRTKVVVVNVLSSAAAVMGAAIIYFARGFVDPWLPHLMAFAGGSFLYLACSDLIPELHHGHRGDEKKYEVWEVGMFGLGVGVVYLLIRWLHG